MAPQVNFFGYGGNGKNKARLYVSPGVYCFLEIHYPSFFLEGEFVKLFSRFDYMEKLLINEYSFNIFLMKLCENKC